LAVCALIVACAALPGWAPAEQISPILYPAPPLEPRLQLLASYRSDADVFSPQSAFERLVVGPREERQIGKPYGLAIHDGQILVCDTAAGVVLVLDLEARAVELLGLDDPGRLRKPVNVAVDADGTRYVSDTKLRRVMIYDRSNRFLRAFGDPERLKPSGVAIAGEHLYVTDLEAGQVVVLDKSSGEEIERFSQRGVGPGDLGIPANLAVDGAGNLYVSDIGSFRVVKFDAQGRLLSQFGSLGDRIGQFVRPKGVAVDREGRLYVVDAASQVVQIFDEEGALLLFFGGAGNRPGDMNLPAGVSIDYDNVALFADRAAPGYAIEYLILVSSQYGPNKINVYGFLGPRARED